jgi:transcriptional regulator with XRE-family HTH domain
VLSRGLGGELRRHRERAGLTAEAAAEACGAPVSAVEELESGHVGVSARTLADLLSGYGVADEAERVELLLLRERAAGPGWWRSYADIVTRQYETYLRLEGAASVIRSYDPHVVPRLLQTRDYAAATIRLGFSRLGTTHLGITRPEDVERQIDIRMRRQSELLDAPDGPILWAVVEEAALRLGVGDPEVSRAQLTHLMQVTGRPRVTLQVVPVGPAGPVVADTPFTLMRFAQGYLPDVAYVEQMTRPLYLEKRLDVDHYTMLMERLVARAERPSRTSAILSAIRGGR